VTLEDATHRAIVARLTTELTPARALWSPWARLACWLALALAVVGVAAVSGLRHDLGVVIDRPGYVFELAILLAGAGLAATLALLAAVPGRMGGRRARALGAGLLVLALAAALLGETGVAPATRTAFADLRCVACVGLFGLVPWLALYRAVGRAAPLDGTATALCVGAAAFLVGAAAVRVACPYDDVAHLAVWHGLPVALWTVVSTVLAGAGLARWMDDGVSDRHTAGG
jgi:hypothetical protein